ncbi:MAG: DUF5682 family protein [Lachnoclostridium sp.]|nr:DUF5682 family protein [Lachnoclostridium sp.]MCM1385631.1 DUF5682 family protein [Lachnoclostridium sp.]
MQHPHIFGIRHLSPAGAWHLRQFLEEKKPRLVLVEGPSDLNDQIGDITRPETKAPIAIMAYTREAPIHTILYPFAEYSPEYQAICWCKERGVECRFMDLPSDVFLALPAERKSTEGEEGRMSAYELLDRQAGEDGHETFWERTMEHTGDASGYHRGAGLFGENLRQINAGNDEDFPEILVREAFMRRQIQNAVEEGFAPEEIVVVTGAYHVAGLMDEEALPMTEEEFLSLPKVEASHTLMPYSYYRLSSRAGYGAGNKAPAYYHLLWNALQRKDFAYTADAYLSRIAVYQREHGNPVSSAEVIEAVRLANSLAALRGGKIPALRDLRDAAVTCLGGGSFAAISLATADTEIGTMIGALPEGVSRTSIQEDFYRRLKELKLEKYRDITAQDLPLDLRENRNVSTQKSAFLDLNRSFFLHQLRVLGISFAKEEAVKQENATWAEHWVARWSPEAEIELVEAALKGDTVAQAASFRMKERVENAQGMGEIAKVIEDAFTCGMAAAVQYATNALQAMAVDAASLEELAATAHRLSVVVQYGSIRKLDAAPLEPILQQLFYRACLILPGACICDDAASKEMVTAIERLNGAALAHDFLDGSAWLEALEETAGRDDLNTKLSGFAMAVLLERGLVDNEKLRLEVSRRLSKGVPADLGAGWFEGLAMKNRYALIARLSLWESLDEYLDGLTEEEFKRALVFLRRAFADFSAMEKDEIAENLGEIWNLNGGQVSEALNQTLSGEEQKMVESLEEFDFDF